MTNVSQIREKQKKAKATVAIATVSPSEGASERMRVLDFSWITVWFQKPQTLWHTLQKLND